MGLDQYLVVRGVKELSWRNHNSLHGLMVSEWVRAEQAGGNLAACEEDAPAVLKIGYVTLERMEKVIRPCGFAWLGFNGSVPTRDDRYSDQDKKMVELCKRALASGSEVFYLSDF